MRVLIKSCTIIDESSPFNNQICDILIEDERIAEIAKEIQDTNVDKIIEKDNLHASVGWYDARVNFQDPGQEIKETIKSGLKAAELGGITAVSITPNTSPALSNKTQIEYAKNKAQFSPVEIHPYGTLTESLKGKNIAEYYDMSQAGAIGFTDGHQPVSAGIMYRALLYVKNINSKVISFPYDNSIFGDGQINESKASVLTGLKSIPSISEYLVVEREISLVEYTDSAIHFTGISSQKSVELIRQAKARGLNVTADTYAHQLIYTDQDVMGFDSNYKVLPPLRTENDRQALIEGLKDGTIDFICSDHTPEDSEHKDLEFDLASFGMIGTQILFSTINKVETLTLAEKIKYISSNPRAVMGLNNTSVNVNELANLTLFDPDIEYKFEVDQIASLSKNSPLIGTTLKGKALGIINKGFISIFEN